MPATFLNRSDLADQIISGESPREAKAIACVLNCDSEMANWDKIKTSAMSMILRAKWNCSGRFRQTLMATGRMTIAEATQDMYWGVIVAPNLAQHTNPNKFLGLNKLGKCLMDLRDSVEDINPQTIDDVTFNLSPLASRKHPVNSDDLMDSSDSTNADDSESVQPVDPVVSDTLVVHPTSTDTLAASSTSNDTVGNLSTSDGSKDTNPPVILILRLNSPLQTPVIMCQLHRIQLILPHPQVTLQVLSLPVPRTLIQTVKCYLQLCSLQPTNSLSVQPLQQPQEETDP